MAFGRIHILQPGVGTTSTPRGPRGNPGPPGPGLTAYKTASNNASVSHNGIYTTILTLGTDFIEAGTYRLGVSYNWKHSSNSDPINMRIILDGDDTTGNEIHIMEETTAQPADINVINDTEYVTLSSGIHTFELQIQVSGGNTGEVFNRTLEFWKDPS